jgi:peptidoglycan/xylan/chitin deacetylase (PgdA/CDA1 family)
VDRRTLLKRLGIGGASVLGASVPVGTYFAGLHNGETHLSGANAASFSAGERTGQVRVWWSVDASPTGVSKRLALTFDDGPTTQFTARVLNILAAAKVPATFFMIGACIDKHRDLAERVHGEGHLLANHTYDHYTAAIQSPDDVMKTVERGADAVARITGERPRWFRPVRGQVTGALMQAVASAGHDLAMWSVSRGAEADDDDAVAVREHYIESIEDGAIVIFHDGIGRSSFDFTGPDGQLMTQRTAEISALPAVIDRYLADGYEFLSLTDLVDRSATQSPAT